MGDRVLVGFKSGGDYSPTIYMHWAGSDAAKMIADAQHLMRKGDASYAAAQFCGYAASKISSTTGLGLLDALDGTKGLADQSHGDAGVYVVDVDTGEVSHGGGYGEPFQMKPENFSE